MKPSRILFPVLMIFLSAGLAGQAQANDGHIGGDMTVGCASGAVMFGAAGAYLGTMAGHTYWRDEAWEGAVIGCGVGVAVGGISGAVASEVANEAPSEDELNNADLPAQDQE